MNSLYLLTVQFQNIKNMMFIFAGKLKKNYLFDGPSPTKYSTILSMMPLSLGIIGLGKGGPPLNIPGGIPPLPIPGGGIGVRPTVAIVWFKLAGAPCI